MTEIAVRQDNAVSIIQTAAADMEAAHRMAVALVSTAFAPAHFQRKPDDATAAILYGAAIGLDPLASLQNIYVISGRPAMYARAMMAVVLSHGHEMWTEESTPARVVVCGRRKGSEHVERSEWTYDRARKAGYTSNKKYDTDPQSMLYARASGDVARHIAPDALLGMAYSVEELEQAPAGADGVPAITTVRTGADRLREAIGTPPPQEPVKTTAERGDSLRTEAQSKALHAGLTALQITDRDAGLAYISQLIGRDIDSTRDLTRAEASTAIDLMKAAEDAARSTGAPEAPVDEPADEGWPEVATAGAR
jgi:hypothetical protein